MKMLFEEKEDSFGEYFDTQYNNLLNSQNIITFNPWNIPNKLNSFWGN